MTREAWQIDFTDKDGNRKSVVHLHNAIGDYRDIDPSAVVTRLTEPLENKETEGEE